MARQFVLEVRGSKFDCLGWEPNSSGRVMAVISGDHAPGAWEPFARLLEDEFRVVALPQGAEGVLDELLIQIGGAPVVVAHADACSAALRLAASSPHQISGLVLSDFRVSPLDAPLGKYSVRTMLLRGRQCTRTTHADAVKLHEAMPGSRLIEPEDCGDWPFGSCPEACATAVKWFASQAGHVEYFLTDDDAGPAGNGPLV